MDDLPVVVVGSGPTGAIAAHVLAGRGVPTVVLDAGLRAPRGVFIKVAGRTVFRAAEGSMLSVDRHVAASDPSTTWLSSWSLGGLTNYWTGAVPRFAPTDFSEGGRLDERYEWPIRYEDLAPYYEQAEHLLRPTAGAVAIPGVPPGWSAHEWKLSEDWSQVQRSAALASEPLGIMPMAKGEPWSLRLRPREFDSYRSVLAPDRRSGRVEVVTGAVVRSIERREGVPTVVRYVDRRTRTLVRRPARAVVLAAGPLDTTEILLRSPDLATSDNLGRYLHEHPRRWYVGELDRAMSIVSHPVYVPRAAPETSAPLLATASTLGPASQRDQVRWIVRGRSARVGVQVFGTVVPRHDRRVLLDGPADDGTDSKLRIELSYDAAEVANMLEAEARTRAVLAAGGLGLTFGPAHDLAVGSSVHYGGTARMHRDRTHGVVDQWNRLFDAPDVLVVDAACFTTGPEKNPTLTGMAIAARAADALGAALGYGPTVARTTP